MTAREWTVYYNEDGEPWAIFLNGHNWDLRTINSAICRREMREAFQGDDDGYFAGNLNIGRWWIRDGYQDDDADPDLPWKWCEKDDEGAVPITGAKF